MSYTVAFLPDPEVRDEIDYLASYDHPIPAFRNELVRHREFTFDGDTWSTTNDIIHNGEKGAFVVFWDAD